MAATAAAHDRAQTLRMVTEGTHHLVDRTYREGGSYQWVRETYTNAAEASATRVEFGIEWQAVETLGVYRRLIADDGRGMTPEELREFFNTFGGGGKPIGGVHENFGVGAKTSLLPWNRYGVVVVSWVEDQAAMIRLHWDEELEEYGLALVEAEDQDTGELSLEAVYEPYDDPDDGCDWSKLKPGWMGENGTVIVLMGNARDQDTVQGDPNRQEADIKGISTYLNRRLWEIPDGQEVYVDELRTNERAQWPDSEAVSRGPQPNEGPDRRTNLRKIEGANYYIKYPVASFSKGRLKDSGTVSLQDGTAIDWYLWDGERPAVQSYAAISGYIAANYKNELYDVATHTSTYRSFGITEASVRRRSWLIARPPMLGNGNGKSVGVYPRTDRNTLLLKGGPEAGGPLPMLDWARQFAEQMPQPIVDAIGQARTGNGGSLDDTWRERLAERFGSRWRIPKYRASSTGTFKVELQESSKPKRIKNRRRRGGRTGTGGTGGTGGTDATGGNKGPYRTGTEPGNTRAERKMVAGGVPSYKAVQASDVDEGMLASWSPREPGYPEGAVLLNVEHPVLRAEIEHFQGQYADHLAEDVANEVIKTYGEIVVSKVAHSEHLRRHVPSEIIEREFRSSAALTMSLLGLIAEESLIAPRLGGRFKKKGTSR